ncbi:MAG: 30S ribosomal protein S16 [Candidatus Dojkabacteria bacterium]
MVKIRLTRIGKIHAPVYRVVAIQARTKRDGRALEYLGQYNPRTQPKTIVLDKERIQYWLGNGAQPTETVLNLLIKEGIVAAPKEKKVYSKKPGKKKSEREGGEGADDKSEKKQKKEAKKKGKESKAEAKPVATEKTDEEKKK